mmetsp:Transcript_937/g.2591  ORF Transcript_937/g.2591 Transcript_937/m.2591 type:complete len:310 (-) Transcript_937:360-1289(-)
MAGARIVVPAYLACESLDAVPGVCIGSVPTLAYVSREVIAGGTNRSLRDVSIRENAVESREDGEATESDFLLRRWTLRAIKNSAVQFEKAELMERLPELCAYDSATRRVSIASTVNRINGALLEPESGPTRAISMQFSPAMMVTMKMGPPELMDVEQALLAELTRVKSCVAYQSTLWMFDDVVDGAGCVLEWHRAKEYPLRGTSWSLRGVNNGKGGVVSGSSADGMVFNIAEDGALIGRRDHGVVLTGSLHISGDSIEVIRVEAVDANPADEISTVVNAWKMVKTASAEGHSLMLRSESGALALSLKAI